MEWSGEELKETCSQTEFCTSDISYDLQTGGEDGNVNVNDNDNDNDDDNDKDKGDRCLARYSPRATTTNQMSR